MTTRNFRVHNGISVGDIVIDASANTITGGATAAPSADGDNSLTRNTLTIRSRQFQQQQSPKVTVT